MVNSSELVCGKVISFVVCAIEPEVSFVSLYSALVVLEEKKQICSLISQEEAQKLRLRLTLERTSKLRKMHWNWVVLIPHGSETFLLHWVEAPLCVCACVFMCVYFLYMYPLIGVYSLHKCFFYCSASFESTMQHPHRLCILKKTTDSSSWLVFFAAPLDQLSSSDAHRVFLHHYNLLQLGQNSLSSFLPVNWHLRCLGTTGWCRVGEENEKYIRCRWSRHWGRNSNFRRVIEAVCTASAGY